VPRLLVDVPVGPPEAPPSPALRAPLRPASASAAGTIAAVVGVLVLGRSDLGAWGVVVAVTAAVLVWLAAIDLESRLIPNRIVVPTAAAVLVVAFSLDASRGLEHSAAALGAGGFLLLAASLRPGALGMGDVKLVVLLGALLGAAVLDALMIGFVLVAGVGLVLVARHGRAALTRHLPLAPFLAAGAIVTLLVG
jgi:leader peptidase (prepilin peptidase) / N-methyltransferase